MLGPAIPRVCALALAALLCACPQDPSPEPGEDAGSTGPDVVDGGLEDAGRAPDGGPGADGGGAFDGGPVPEVPGWWRGDVPFRQRLRIDPSVAPDGYAVKVAFDHAALVDAGRSEEGGQDLHVVARDGNGWVELPRLLDPLSAWGRADTALWFRSSGAPEVFLYYGNPRVPARDAAWSEVFTVGDDFEDGALDPALQPSSSGVAVVGEESGRARVDLDEEGASAGALSLDLPEDAFVLSTRVAMPAAGPGPLDEARLFAVEEASAPVALGDDAQVASRTRIALVHRASGALLVSRTDAGGARHSWDGGAWIPGDALWAAVTPGAPFVVTLVSTGTSWRLEIANGEGALLTTTTDIAWADTRSGPGALAATFGEPLVERSFADLELDWLYLRPSLTPEPVVVVGAEEGVDEPRCDDGVKNADETGVDCGGGCEGCPLGEPCLESGDCAAGACGDEGTCRLAVSCLELLEANPALPTGTYAVDAGAGPVEVFCEMTRAGGGWTRVVSLDAVADGCPDGWTFVDAPGVCAGALEAAGERSVVFDAPVESYGEVMGYAVGYAASTPDAFGQYHVTGATLDDPYVDGVSVTTPPPEREHIWTYAATHRNQQGYRASCPCRGGEPPPAFVGDDYWCEHGDVGSYEGEGWHVDEGLWDQDANGWRCDVGGNPSWFEKALSAPRSGPLEVRILADEDAVNEDIGLSRLELYVR